MHALLPDLKYTIRKLLTRPGFVVTTVVSLALGVGVNATFFSAANTMLIQPMKVPRSGEMVRVYRGHHSPFTFDEFLWLRERTKSVSQLFAETHVVASFTRTEPVRARVAMVSGNVFRALEVLPSRGRLFVRDDDRQPAAAPEVVLAHSFWRSALAGDSTVIGSTVRLNEGTFTIVGVAPEGFHSTQQGWGADLFVPLGDAPALIGTPVSRMGGSLYVTGRLARGRSVDDAKAELSLIGTQLALSDRERYPDGAFIVKVRPARGITEEVRLPATVASAFMMGLAALILVIAATNVGNVLLARNATRRLELGVRLALGATRRRVVRLLLLESAVVALLSAVGAIALARWTTRLLPRFLPEDAEVFFDLTPDWRVILFTGFAAFAALLVFGLLPALQATRLNLAEGIKQDSGTGTRAGARMRRRFLMVQVALCTVLLATASLFLRSLGRAKTVETGFRPDGVLIAPYIDVRNLPRDEGIAFFRRLVDESSRVPGVASATLSGTPELTGSNSETQFYRDGDVAGTDGRDGTRTYFNVVGAGYHGTLGIPLLKGRDFSSTDVTGAPLVAIVNETFAARTWPGEEPIGKRISMVGADVRGTGGATRPWMEVIGVSRNVKYHTLGEEAKLFLAVPHAQQYQASMSLELRLAPGAPERAVGDAVTSILRSLQPGLAPPRIQRLTEMQRVVLLPAMMAASLLGAIGGLAVILAGVGIAGVASFAVTQRRREIGVRVALGAQPAALLRAVLGETWRAVAIGAAAGLVLAVAVARLVSSQLYGLPFADPVTFAAVPALLVMMSLLSAWQPARRAVSVQPSDALRTE